MSITENSAGELEFGDALKKERKLARKTLKETSDFVNRSVGYISDIEQKRSGPPDIDIVMRFEELFGIEDGRLVAAAKEARTVMPKQIYQDLQAKPKLKSIFFRMKNMTDEQMDEVLEQLDRKLSSADVPNSESTSENGS